MVWRIDLIEYGARVSRSTWWWMRGRIFWQNFERIRATADETWSDIDFSIMPFVISTWRLWRGSTISRSNRWLIPRSEETISITLRFFRMISRISSGKSRIFRWWLLKALSISGLCNVPALVFYIRMFVWSLFIIIHKNNEEEISLSSCSSMKQRIHGLDWPKMNS